ncbi:hypothetical protein [Staphylococcus sp. GDX8P105P-2]|uniref:hypothetical protein n=1 Tax=Staphylococcus sp. GDX8P105P-2 TaxID=2804107 RepID=UPI001AEC1A1B|nr:hypothetical protein [Staphylococcus sp. GDX8P105P-2]
MKWILFSIQMILAIFLVFFAYKQMNQNYLDSWFGIYVVLFMIFVYWNAKRYYNY